MLVTPVPSMGYQGLLLGSRQGFDGVFSAHGSRSILKGFPIDKVERSTRSSVFAGLPKMMLSEARLKI